VIGSDGGDELNAEAVDLDASDSGERQHLTVSMQALDQDRTYEVPDFELEPDPDTVPPHGLYEAAEAIRAEDNHKAFPIIPVIAAIVVGVLIILALLWFVFGRGRPNQNAVAVQPTVAAEPAPVAVEPAAPVVEVAPAPAEAPKSEPVAVVEQPAPVKPAPEPPVVVANRARPPAPVKSYKVPLTIPKEGVRYKIRWGDTLWDISEAFYRNPWLYPRVARFNKIRNPDLIISGTFIRIPPKQ
jgi:hypothetical protein